MLYAYSWVESTHIKVFGSSVTSPPRKVELSGDVTCVATVCLLGIPLHFLHRLSPHGELPAKGLVASECRAHWHTLHSALDVWVLDHRHLWVLGVQLKSAPAALITRDSIFQCSQPASAVTVTPAARHIQTHTLMTTYWLLSQVGQTCSCRLPDIH